MNIDDLKRALPKAAALVELLGLTDGAAPQTDGIMIRCPFHHDSTPSCSVRDYDNGIGVKCFGCGKTGSAFDLIAVGHGLDPQTQFKNVLEVARTLATSPSDDAAVDAPGEQTAHPIDDAEFDQHARALLELCPIQQNESVSAYMKGRGLFERAVADGWGALPDTPADVQVVTREIGITGARMLGLETADGLRFPGHRLVIPWRSSDGVIRNLQRRSIDATVNDRKYIFPAQRATKEPYGVERLRDGKPIAIVEGAMDVLAMRELCERDQMDRDVLGIPGVQNWNKAWNRHVEGRVVLIAVDNDEAGDGACAKLAQAMRSASALDVARRIPRGGKDWASLLETKEAS